MASTSFDKPYSQVAFQSSCGEWGLEVVLGPYSQAVFRQKLTFSAKGDFKEIHKECCNCRATIAHPGSIHSPFMQIFPKSLDDDWLRRICKFFSAGNVAAGRSDETTFILSVRQPQCKVVRDKFTLAFFVFFSWLSNHAFACAAGAFRSVRRFNGVAVLVQKETKRRSRYEAASNYPCWSIVGECEPGGRRHENWRSNMWVQFYKFYTGCSAGYGSLANSLQPM